MAETEQQAFGPRLARLLGVTPNAATDGVATRLRPAVAIPEAVSPPEVAPEVQPPLDLAVENMIGEAAPAPPPRTEDQGFAAETAPPKHTEAPLVVPDELNGGETREPPPQPGPQQMVESPSAAKQDPQRPRTVVRQVVELESPQALVPASAPDRSEQLPPPADSEQTLSPKPSAAPPDPLKEPMPNRERIRVLVPVPLFETPSVTGEQPLLPLVPPVAPDESGQGPSRATPDRSGSGDETRVSASTPAPVAEKADAVTPPSPTSAPELAWKAAPAVQVPPAPEVAQSEQPKVSLPGRAVPPSVKIEIGEVVISVRPPDVRTQRPALSVVRRAPRAHTIPLSGFGKD